MSQKTFFTFLFLVLLPPVRPLPALPHPIQPFLPSQSPVATIPAFPEQSDAVGCPLDLPDELFHGIKSSCGAGKGPVRRSLCCPVLAAWLYSAYSATALGRAVRAPQTSSPYDLPLLPDDSESCVGSLQKALNQKGIQLVTPNETCDVVYCYCGIRLHPFSCPESFSVSEEGRLVGGGSVRRIEKDCLSDGGVDRHGTGAGLGGCSKCLNSLYLLDDEKTGKKSKSGNITTKMHNRDCELMGVTWLLAKNRSAYFHTVSYVLRAIMLTPEGSGSRSCILGTDGMPLAVDSSQINDQSSSTFLRPLPVALSLCFIILFVSRGSYYITPI